MLISRFELIEACWRHAGTEHTSGRLELLAGRHRATRPSFRALCHGMERARQISD